MQGTRLLEVVRRTTLRNGQALVFTRRPTTQGGTATAQTLYAIPQSLSITDLSSLYLEGMQNANQNNTTRFILAGDADVVEGTDTITFDGNTWRVVNTNQMMQNGVATSLHVTAMRER